MRDSINLFLINYLYKYIIAIKYIMSDDNIITFTVYSSNLRIMKIKYKILNNRNYNNQYYNIRY